MYPFCRYTSVSVSTWTTAFWCPAVHDTRWLFWFPLLPKKGPRNLSHAGMKVDLKSEVWRSWYFLIREKQSFGESVPWNNVVGSFDYVLNHNHFSNNNRVYWYEYLENSIIHLFVDFVFQSFEIPRSSYMFIYSNKRLFLLIYYIVIISLLCFFEGYYRWFLRFHQYWSKIFIIQVFKIYLFIFKIQFFFFFTYLCSNYFKVSFKYVLIKCLKLFI